MSRLLSSWRRLIAIKGRPMTLRRQTATSPAVFSDVTVRAAAVAYQPEAIAGDLKMGDLRVSILNDEIAAASWPGPPRARDQMTIDGKTYVLQAATPRYDGETLVGFTIWVRGGPGA